MENVIEQRANEYLNASGTFFAKDHFYVWRSLPLIQHGVDTVVFSDTIQHQVNREILIILHNMNKPAS